jgi:surfactin synthase thioesterase subunit
MAAETFAYEDAQSPDIPLTVITGTNETMQPEDIKTWQKETSCPASFYKMPGNHFFILDNAQAIVSVMIEKLRTAYHHY